MSGVTTQAVPDGFGIVFFLAERRWVRYSFINIG